MSSTERGFTVAELIAVLIVLGVLAAVAVPKLSVVDQLKGDNWREQTVAGLRLAQVTAVGHRRLVCASFDAAGLLNLRVAGSNPANDCTQALAGPGGSDGRFGSAAPGAAVSVLPAGTLYFQPGGQVSSDGAGTQVAGRQISAGSLGSITVRGQSGHVD